MLFTKTTFIGVDPTAGKRPFAYAALDDNLRTIALAKGEMEDVLEFVGGQEHAFVAINAPRMPNMGLMRDENVRAQISPVPRPGRWTDYRVAEYLLRHQKIAIPRTPYELEKVPRWMKAGFEVFRHLQSNGYQAYPNEDAPHQTLEVYPHGCFQRLLGGKKPFPKKTLEGRIQRQLVLYVEGLDVVNPMRVFEEITRHRLLKGILPLDGLLAPGELDALIAAYTAWMAVNRADQIEMVGDLVEGQIAIPLEKRPLR